MTQYIFANNVNTSLFAPITSTATSLTLLSATNLPTLAAGQVMPLTLNDKATRTVFEIVYVTAISGTNLTVIRGQEGTAAQNWNAGDYAYSTQTAQTTELAIQSGAYNYATDTGTTANAYVVTLTPAIPATIPDGFPLTMYVTPARANTGAATLNGVAILDGNGQPILAGQLKNSCALRYNAGLTAWQFFGARQTVSVLDFGADPTGVADSTVAIQAAVNYAVSTGKTLYAPSGVYLLTSTISATGSFSLVGDMPQPYVGTQGTRGLGTWFYLNHLGKGFSIIPGGSNASSGAYFDRIGTFRNQPAPGTGWAPVAADFDFYFNDGDAIFGNVMLLNATNGIQLDNGGFGRLHIGSLRGQCFQKGLYVTMAADVVSVEHIHFWPFWSTDANVLAYMLANLDSVYLIRCDNPQFGNVFAYSSRSGLRIDQDANGTTSKFKIANFDADLCQYPIYLDPTITSGATGQIANCTVSGNSGQNTGVGVGLFGQNSTLDIANLRVDATQQNAVRADGTGNTIRIGSALIENWNQGNGGFPAIEAVAGNTIELSQPAIVFGGNGAATYSGPSEGQVHVPDWISYDPTVASSSGTITTVGAVNGRYRRAKQRVEVEFDVTITTVGTASGVLEIGLPLAADTEFACGAARDTTNSGKMIVAQAGGANTYATCVNYDGTFPATSGSRIVGSVSYSVP